MYLFKLVFLGGWIHTHKSTEIYSLRFLRVRSSKSVSLGQNQKVGRATLASQSLRENPFFASFWWLLVFLDLRLCHCSLQGQSLLISLFHFHTAFSSAFDTRWYPIFLCLSLIKIHIISFSAH